MTVYILSCNDGSYYTGVTNDIEKRMREHSDGVDARCYTFKRRPLKLVLCEEFSDPVQAISREKQIKGWSRAKKEALINGDGDKLSELSHCYRRD